MKFGKGSGDVILVIGFVTALILAVLAGRYVYVNSIGSRALVYVTIIVFSPIAGIITYVILDFFSALFYSGVWKDRRTGKIEDHGSFNDNFNPGFAAILGLVAGIAIDLFLMFSGTATAVVDDIAAMMSFFGTATDMVVAIICGIIVFIVLSILSIFLIYCPIVSLLGIEEEYSKETSIAILSIEAIIVAIGLIMHIYQIPFTTILKWIGIIVIAIVVIGILIVYPFMEIWSHGEKEKAIPVIIIDIVILFIAFISYKYTQWYTYVSVIKAFITLFCEVLFVALYVYFAIIKQFKELIKNFKFKELMKIILLNIIGIFIIGMVYITLYNMGIIFIGLTDIKKCLELW